MASEALILANRRNAAKPAGPRMGDHACVFCLESSVLRVAPPNSLDGELTIRDATGKRVCPCHPLLCLATPNRAGYAKPSVRQGKAASPEISLLAGAGGQGLLCPEARIAVGVTRRVCNGCSLSQTEAAPPHDAVAHCRAAGDILVDGGAGRGYR